MLPFVAAATGPVSIAEIIGVMGLVGVGAIIAIVFVFVLLKLIYWAFE